MRKCSIDGCSEFAPYVKVMLCNKHYRRIHKKPKTDEEQSRFILGQSKTTEYKSWRKIIERCLYPNSVNYHRYGGKGITVCDRWLGKYGFINFLNDVGHKPTPEHSIDRIDSNGNYEPSNCRWATKAQQAFNRSSTSKHHGVSFDNRRSKWHVKMIHKKEIVLDKFFDNLEDAVAARKAAELKYLGVILQTG